MQAAEPRLDGILALKGVIEVLDEDEHEEERGAAEAVIAGFGATMVELVGMRRREGEALGQVLTQRIKEIGALTAGRTPRPAADPKRSRPALPNRWRCCSMHPERFDSDRLHQEAILIASKADIREELDRLASHVAQVERLIASRRGHRPPARFPRAGAQSRGQHVVLQVERC